MFDDVSDYKKARSNLMLISLAVIIYILGEGMFKGGSFLDGSIQFENPIILSLAASLIFIFICWRFLLLSSNAIGEFSWDFNTLLYNSPTYTKINKD